MAQKDFVVSADDATSDRMMEWIGAGFLASELIPDFDWNLAWPGVLIACGVLLIAGALRRPVAGP